MTYAKTTIAIISLSIVSMTSLADETEVYSTEGYCLLEKAGESKRYLEAYADKLGDKPSRKVCRSFNEFVEQAKPKDWDYRGGKPYPGSALRLTPKQIERLKAAKSAESE